MNQGWIKVPRKIYNDKGFWSNEGLVRVYLYLLFNAKVEPETVHYLGQAIELKANELITGRKIIAQQCGLSESTVERNLKWLENGQMIGQKTDKRFRLISILYEGSRTQSGHKADAKWTQNGHINKKENNNKNKKVDVEVPEVVDRKYYFDLFKKVEADELNRDLVLKTYNISQWQFKHHLQQFFREKEVQHHKWSGQGDCQKNFFWWLKRMGDAVRKPIPEPAFDKSDIDEFYNSRLGPADRI